MNSSWQNKNTKVFVVTDTTGAIGKALTPKRFHIAVVDFDTVMTDNSRPKADIDIPQKPILTTTMRWI